ncbi:alpha/beta hydrolase [Salinibacterium sp. G-O1]|uniref:alpha/beta fold hydrolase n=1 Tax=Salinibacterium sp. G-O1 TaxID=3046208 RepID=UPI0024BA937E|nr:alpha/beta hydrolase [Salinibacterium sp. G-O1]MDJ0335612.1 alpha/beta hydrolase [Salinibacterium sp. G-O1]
MHNSAAPEPRRVMAADGVAIATYEFGDPDASTVLLVHGFASSALGNWHLTGWVRDLLRAGRHVIAIDQRGHGASDKPHDPRRYSMQILAEDVLTVLDAFLLGEVQFAGYSLGARVGWKAAREYPDRITAAVLGGIPDGDPLTRFRVDQAREFIANGEAPDDRLTATYVQMAAGIPNNDLSALLALVEGMRDGEQPNVGNAPSQQLLFATGSDDRIVEKSRALSAASPHGTFFEIPGRNHFNAPTSREFRAAAIEFLAEQPN